MFLNELFEALDTSFLYHNTSITSFLGMLKKGGVIGRPTDWDVSKGYQSIKPGWISFSRSKNYKIAPGIAGPREVRLVFDRNRLRNKYKIKPHADLFVADPKDPDKFVSSYHSRWEAEERVYGLIKFTDGLVRIDITLEAFNELKQLLTKFKEYTEHELSMLEKLKDGLFWNRIKQTWQKFETEKQRKVHDNPDKIKNRIHMWNEETKLIEYVLNHPKLNVIQNENF